MEKLQVSCQKGVVNKKSKVRCVRYGECERNYAVNNGGFAVDGCKEFIASDENGDSALKCSCCGCHRNFHRIVEETDQESFGVEEQKEKKRRKLKSMVWDDFTKCIDKDGIEWAICKHCNGQFDGSSKKGTTHLKNHLESMKCRAKRNRGDVNQEISTQTRDLATLTPVIMKEKSSVIDLIKQSFDEDGEFTKDWNPLVLNSRKDEILQMYQEEKEKQDKLLSNLSCCFSLHIYHLDDNLIFMVHYIDDSWERQKKIISIIPSENYIQETKKTCLDLKIDRNICSIQYDGLAIDDDDKEIIESWFSQRGSLPFAGVGLDFHGFMQKIEPFREEWEINEIDGLRECADYGYKKVIFDDHPISPCFYDPFKYLELAVGLKESFSELEKVDSDFISINLTNQKWDVDFEALKDFVDSFCCDNCSCITTTVIDILKLFRFHSSEDCQVCKNESYKNLFDQIHIYLILVILDPRFKMDTIQRLYEEIYGSDADGYLEKILKDFGDVYNEYAKQSSEDYKMMDAMGRPCASSTKSELDLYLHHLKVPAIAGFDKLAWWRGNAHFYPTLSRMARDYLRIPLYIDLPLPEEIYGIKYCYEIYDGIESALIYLLGLLYFQAQAEQNK